MAAVNYTIRLDEADKKAAEQVFNELGLTMAAGLNVYVKMVARHRRIPFDLALDERKSTTARDQKKKSIMALSGLLAGYDVDLSKEREERILSK
jgi:DNA-damage-inducible protein J